MPIDGSSYGRHKGRMDEFEGGRLEVPSMNILRIPRFLHSVTALYSSQAEDLERDYLSLSLPSSIKTFEHQTVNR